MTRTLFTIGYEQATQAAVVSALRVEGVEVLADTRYLPLLSLPKGAPLLFTASHIISTL